jgi:hypothetical protein
MRVVVHIPARAEWRALLAVLPPHPPSQTLPIGEGFALGWTRDALPMDLFVLRGGLGKRAPPRARSMRFAPGSPTCIWYSAQPERSIPPCRSWI